ncbi:MAG: transposase [candidate division Zixibacteria bacterium]|nr:transposase [candidate division Zixibacteria bacterium]
MKSLRRFHIPGASYFVTVVTCGRRRFLLENLDLFWHGWDTVALDAWVVLPDHFHAIVRPDPKTISQALQSFKLRFSRRYFQRHGKTTLWQNRFWDHVIREEMDMAAHLDYIHYNPVHHGLVSSPFDYANSSLMNWYEKGAYAQDWGVTVEDYSQWIVGEPVQEDVG